MNKHIKSIITLAGALCALPLGSAYAEDNTTNIISGTVVDNLGGWIEVGSSGTNNYREINSGGELTNCAGSLVGNLVGANNNNALVTGSGSLWTANGSLWVGNAGGDNSLKISDGGTVKCGSSLNIGLAATANNNSLLVTGSGSVLDVNDVVVFGNSGASNSLTIADGGAAKTFGEIYIGNSAATAANNSLLVTGSGSILDVNSVIFMGMVGPSNSLTISNGGTVNLVTGTYHDFYVGYTSGNNRALVTGAGSAFNTAGSVYVGTFNSSGNSLTITNGGTVNSSGNCTAGHGAGSSSNTVTITGEGSALDIPGSVNIGNDAASTNNVLNLGNGGLIRATFVTIGGVGSVFNFGDGTTPVMVNVYRLVVYTDTARLNINAGVLKARVSDDLFIVAAPLGNAYIQSGGAVIDSNGKTVRIPIALQQDDASPGGGLIKIGAGTLQLAGANTYTGPTTASNGTLNVTGSLVSGADVKSGAILTGSGAISGAVTVEAGATLQPGLGDLDTSTLTINNTLNLGGTAVLALNRTNAQTASKVSGITTLTLGGVVNVVNVGDALQAGDTFTLFNATSVSGTFSATNLPSLDPGLTWNFNGRVLTVMGNVDPTPTNIVYGVSGSTLTLTWPGSHLGWYAQSNSANVASPSSWFDIAGSQAVTNLSITINPAWPRVFYRLRYP